jgi:hypothetical protein
MAERQSQLVVFILSEHHRERGKEESLREGEKLRKSSGKAQEKLRKSSGKALGDSIGRVVVPWQSGSRPFLRQHHDYFVDEA